jgi:hypothetical protein
MVPIGTASPLASLMTLVAVLFAQQLARASEPQRLNVSWIAPPGCPTLADVQISISRLLGPSSGTSTSTEIVARARASPQDDGRWLGVVETQLGTKSGKRSLYAESCEAVASATALIIALMVDPDAVAAHQAEDAGSNQTTTSGNPKNGLGSLEPAAPASTGNSPQVETIGPVTQPRPPIARFFIGPRIAANSGTLPTIALGAGADIGASFTHGSIETGLLEWTDSRATIAGTQPEAGGTFHLLSWYLAACPTKRSGSFDFGVCGQLSLNWVKGIGFGVSNSYENSFAWLSGGAGLLVRTWLGQRFSVPLRVETSLPFAHPTFTLNGVSQSRGQVFRPQNVAGQVCLGFDWTL